MAGTCRRPSRTQLTAHGRTNAVGACIRNVGSFSANLRLQPKTAFSRFPLVRRTNL